jgi:hypothetical protein
VCEHRKKEVQDLKSDYRHYEADDFTDFGVGRTHQRGGLVNRDQFCPVSHRQHEVYTLGPANL